VRLAKSFARERFNIAMFVLRASELSSLLGSENHESECDNTRRAAPNGANPKYECGRTRERCN
jgi:hypothetical protein